MAEFIKNITEEMIRKMAVEDSWVGTFANPSDPKLASLRSLPGNSGDPVKSIMIMESKFGNASYNKSPAAHCFLGHLYASSREISDIEKYAFELLKLNETGEKDLISYLSLTDSKIPESLRGKVKDVTAYLKMDNKARAVKHIEDSLNMSGSHNPTVFHSIIEPVTLGYMREGFNLFESYNQAKRRVEGISSIYINVRI